MRRIDELFTAWPFLGSRRMIAMLKAEGLQVNRKRRAAVDAQDGHRGAGTKAEHDEASAGPQDLSLSVAQLDDRPPNQVWAADITYLPIGRGFLYLVAIIDWTSRVVLAWRLSNTMDVSFCVEALAKYGTPEISNTGQGSQFTSAAFTGALAGAGIKISMDGRGRLMNNVFIERLWRSLKHEDIYLKGYAAGREAKAGGRELDHLLRSSPSSGARLSHADGGLARTDAGREGC